MEISHRFRLIEYDDASDELKAIYNDVMETMGIPFVINWFKCQASNPILLNGNWQKVKATLFRGKIPMLLKQLILFRVSSERGCNYCSFIHGTTADALGVELCDADGFKVTKHLESNFLPSSFKTAIRVVSRCALDPLSTTDADFEDLRDEGFSEDEIQELMAQADLVNMLNTIADVSGITIDKELLGI